MTTYAAPTEFSRYSAVVWVEGLNGFAIVATDGTILHVNPAFAALLEYSPPELEGVHFRDVTVNKDIAPDETNLRLLLEGKIPSYVMAKQYITKFARIVTCKLKVVALRDDDGAVQFLFSQVAPIEQNAPPRFPGDMEAQMSLERAKRSELVAAMKWIISAILGAGLVGGGAYFDQPIAISIGTLLLGVAPTAAMVEKKIGKG